MLKKTKMLGAACAVVLASVAALAHAVDVEPLYNAEYDDATSSYSSCGAASFMGEDTPGHYVTYNVISMRDGDSYGINGFYKGQLVYGATATFSCSNGYISYSGPDYYFYSW